MTQPLAPHAEGRHTLKLHNNEGSSDKVYNLTLEEVSPGRWDCVFEYGRRNSTLVNGKKTKTPTSYAGAAAAFNRVASEKYSNGYRAVGGSLVTGTTETGTSGATASIATAPAASPQAPQRKPDGGLRPQLCGPADRGLLDVFAASRKYAAEEKHDGERRLLRITADGTVNGINRKGYQVEVNPVLKGAAHFVYALNELTGDIVFDGEQVGDVLWVWELRVHEGEDLAKSPLTRRAALLDEIDLSGQSAIRRTLRAETTATKEALIRAVEARDGEGIVFKDLDAPVQLGEPGAKASWRKIKFWNTASCVVGAIKDTKRSAKIELSDDDGGRIQVGSVTIPSNREIPAIGAIVEIRYLYAFPNGGSLYQPTYLGTRDDIDVDACRTSQLVYKADADPA